MAIVLDQFNIYNFVAFAGYTGQASSSFGSNDLQTTMAGSIQIPFTQYIVVDSTEQVSTGYNTYYKMQGWNPISQVYEDWHSMGTPLLDPPSGNPLVNIGIIGTWIDR